MKKKYKKNSFEYFKKIKISKKLNELNYKNILLLRNFITTSGKIIPKRRNYLITKQQRYISNAIKNARLMSFLPFVRLIEPQ